MGQAYCEGCSPEGRVQERTGSRVLSGFYKKRFLSFGNHLLSIPLESVVHVGLEKEFCR